jgi:hypothetical protein
MLTGVGKPGEDGLAGTVDGHWLSKGGVWKFDGQLIGSQADDRFGLGLASDLVYTPRKGRVHNFALDLLDRQVDINDFGFLRRNDMAQLRYRYEETRSDLSHVRDRTTTLRGFYGWNWQGQQISSGIIAERQWTLLNLSRARLELGYRPPRWDDRNSFGNGAFKSPGASHRESFSWAPTRACLWSGGSSVALSRRRCRTGPTGVGSSWCGVPGIASMRVCAWRCGRRNDWILHDEDRRMTSFNAEQISPRMTVEYYFSARQQLRASMQWIGLKAEESDFYEIAPSGHLVGRPQPTAPGSKTSPSPMRFMQLRYRWEIAPSRICSWSTAVGAPWIIPRAGVSMSSLRRNYRRARPRPTGGHAALSHGLLGPVSPKGKGYHKASGAAMNRGKLHRSRPRCGSREAPRIGP